MPIRTTAIVLALAAAGCATSLEPAPQANELPGSAPGAVAAAHGVRMIARAGVWEGTPRGLEQKVTPILVTFVNEGDVPVRVGYNHLRLVSESGRRYSALPPFQVRGSATVQAATAYYPPARFAYAPHLRPFFRRRRSTTAPSATTPATGIASSRSSCRWICRPRTWSTKRFRKGY